MFLEAYFTDEETKAQGSDCPESHSWDAAPSLCVSESPALSSRQQGPPEQSSPGPCTQDACSTVVTWSEKGDLGSCGLGRHGEPGSGDSGPAVILVLWNFLVGITGGVLGPARTWWSPGTGEAACQASHTLHQQGTLGR